MKTVFIYINGILSNPGASDGWTDRAVTFTHTRTEDPLCHGPAVGEKFEYAAGVLTRRWGQSRRAEAIGTMVGYYRRAGYERVIGVGHSNGCDILARVLTDLNVSLDSVHLFDPAADAEDYEEALQMGSVGRIYLYGSDNDRALQKAKATRPLIRWTGWGYGYLGLEGAAFAAKHPDRVFDFRDNALDHGDWFDRATHFESSMTRLLRNEGIDVRPPRVLP